MRAVFSLSINKQWRPQMINPRILALALAATLSTGAMAQTAVISAEPVNGACPAGTAMKMEAGKSTCEVVQAGGSGFSLASMRGDDDDHGHEGYDDHDGDSDHYGDHDGDDD
jgi:hypothetical protein